MMAGTQARGAVALRAERSPHLVSGPGKLLAAAVLVAAVATTPTGSLAAACGQVLLAVACWALGRPSKRALWFLALPATAAILAIVLPFVATGRLEEAGWLGIRASSSMLIAVSLLSAQAPGDLPRNLRALGVPADFAAVIAIMMRQGVFLQSEGKRLLLARRLRGARAPGVDVLARLLTRSMVRGERVDQAMRLRGYRPSALVPARWLPLDVLWILAALAAGLAPRCLGHVFAS